VTPGDGGPAPGKGTGTRGPGAPPSGDTGPGAAPAPSVTALAGTGADTSDQERFEYGRSRRQTVPRAAHAECSFGADRRDPIEILGEQALTRVPEYVPIRNGRMAESPFAFYRGAAAVMASDLAGMPHSGITVQICGDAHAMNFGMFATPERHLVFDVNDFDETLPGPWEWDLKRLAASGAVAAAQLGLGSDAVRSIARGTVLAYQRRMGELARMGHLDVWYAQVGVEEIYELADTAVLRQVVTSNVKKAKTRTSLQASHKLTEVVDGRRRLVDDPPLLQHLDVGNRDERVRFMYDSYVASLPDDRRDLLGRYRFEDVAFKVVGVGSVGTRCHLVVTQGHHEDDILLLQVKEALPSVLESYLGPSAYENHGRRVVEGQRLMQAATDVFLGWSENLDGQHFYVRQFRDMKGSFSFEGAKENGMLRYGQLCGRALARAHARSGDASTILGYLGKGSRFADCIATFSQAYAQQNQRDYEAFVTAIKDGAVEALTGF
jgi:uncharacterized protein (DUF2252 family)